MDDTFDAERQARHCAVINALPNPHSLEVQDPTFCRKPWAPMTPEQLDSYRPKAATATARTETPEQEARRIAYTVGLNELQPLILRLIFLEKEVAKLKASK